MWAVRWPHYPEFMAPATSQEVGRMHIHQEALALGQVDLDELERQAVEFEEEAARLTHKAAAIRQIIAGVQALNGSAGDVLMRSFGAHKTQFEIRPLATDGPRGPKAVLAVMGEEPDRVWKVVEVKREMLRRGWASTPKAVEASIKRLRADGKLEPAGYGHYKLAAPSGAAESIKFEAEAA